MKGTVVAAKRELSLATAFFATLAVLVVGFMRPLDWVGWTCLASSVAFVVLGCFALLKERLSPEHPLGGRILGRVPAEAAVPEPLISEGQAGVPTPEERAVLETSLAALAEAEALAPAEIEPALVWRAAQHIDPGHRVGALEALYALATLQELGLFAPRRLVFVPSHTEYDAELLATITASVLTSLGHAIGPDDVTVVLPDEGAQGRASINVLVEGRRETLGCDFLWKYPPPDLFEELARFRRPDDPRELVCADVDHGTLMFAAIRPDGLDALNRRFPAHHPLFGPP